MGLSQADLPDLGRLEPVDLREVWPNEESDRHDVEEEHEFGDEMEWYNPTGVQQRKIYWRLPTDFGDRDLRTDQYRWLLERVEALHRILAPRVKVLPVPQ